jgi:hypothetical protein
MTVQPADDNGHGLGSPRGLLWDRPSGRIPAPRPRNAPDEIRSCGTQSANIRLINRRSRNQRRPLPSPSSPQSPAEWLQADFSTASAHRASQDANVLASGKVASSPSSPCSGSQSSPLRAAPGDCGRSLALRCARRPCIRAGDGQRAPPAGGLQAQAAPDRPRKERNRRP